jgi:hypothetical protein
MRKPDPAGRRSYGVKRATAVNEAGARAGTGAERTQLRPAAFAAYSARSARSTRRSRLSLACDVAAPMLTSGRMVIVPDFDLLDLGAQALRDARRARRAGVGQQHHEFVPAVAAADVALAQHLAKAVADRRQHTVAREVTVLVVDSLELIDVEEQRRHRRVIAPRASKLRLEALHAVRAVVAAGQAVLQSVVADFGEELDVAQRDAEQRCGGTDGAADRDRLRARRGSNHAGGASIDQDDVADVAGALDPVRPLEALWRFKDDLVGDRLDLPFAPPRIPAIGDALPFAVLAEEDPCFRAVRERRQMPPDRFVQRVRRQRPAERLTEGHQPLQLLCLGVGHRGFRCRGRRFGSRLSAVRVQMKGEHHDEDEQGRHQRDAVGAFDVARDAQQVLK